MKNKSLLKKILALFMFTAFTALSASCGEVVFKATDSLNDGIVSVVSSSGTATVQIPEPINGTYDKYGCTDLFHGDYHISVKNVQITKDGKSITREELNKGDIIAVYFNGLIAESYPARPMGVTKIEVVTCDPAEYKSSSDKYECKLFRITCLISDIFAEEYVPPVVSSVSWVNWSDDLKIRELALNKDTFVFSSVCHIPIYRCTSPEELNQFKAEFSDVFCMNATWDEVPSLNEVTADYTEDFFAENDLFLVYVEAGSCTPRFGVDSVSVEDGMLCVYVRYTYNPEEGDTAMAGWIITIPVNKDLTQDCTKFDAVLMS